MEAKARGGLTLCGMLRLLEYTQTAQDGRKAAAPWIWRSGNQTTEELRISAVEPLTTWSSDQEERGEEDQRSHHGHADDKAYDNPVADPVLIANPTLLARAAAESPELDEEQASEYRQSHWNQKASPRRLIKQDATPLH